MISIDSSRLIPDRPLHRGETIPTPKQSTYICDIDRWINEGGALRPHNDNGYAANMGRHDRHEISFSDRTRRDRA